MPKVKKYQFQLDPSPRKFECPNCKRRTFVRYIDTSSEEFLNDDVGRCDREDNCSHHYPPKQYFIDNPDDERESSEPKEVYEVEQPINIIPHSFVLDSMKKYEKNNFVKYLIALFSNDIAMDLVEKFNIGTSKRWNGANVFWQIDSKGKARQAKVMLYNPSSGSRIKKDQEPHTGYHKIFIAGKSILKSQGIKEPNLRQCFFGEHQLVDKTKNVAIVESEKTAILMSVIYPKCIWLATGGSNGCGWYKIETCKVLTGRNVRLFPDLGKYDEWMERSQIALDKIAHVSVSDLIRGNCTEEEYRQGLDIADFAIVRCEKTGLALTKQGYPIAWDFKQTSPEARKPLKIERILKREEKILYVMKEQNPLVTNLIEQLDLRL